MSYGELKSEITKALGRGATSHLDGRSPVRFYPKVGIYVYYPAQAEGLPTVADAIVTRSARYKTRSGVGVGSTLRQLRQHITVGCAGSTPDFPLHICWHGRNFEPPVAVFLIDRTTKRITEIAVGAPWWVPSRR